MKTLCQITAQYYENYSESETPHWKPKGGQVFNLMVDADDFMYSEEVCIETIKDLLESYSDNHSRFEYVSHELIFCTPIIIPESAFELLFTEKAHAHYNEILFPPSFAGVIVPLKYKK